MANTVIGRVEKVGQVEKFTSKDGKEYQKRELVLDATRYDSLTGERGFSNFPSFEFSGDKVNDLDGLKLGQVVTVSFDLAGVKYEDKMTREIKYFTRVRGYKIEKRGEDPKPSNDDMPF